LIAVIISVSSGWPRLRYEAWTAAAIAIGLIGCVWAGAASDKLQSSADSVRIAQRARVTVIAMVISAACCVVGAFVFHRPALLVALSMVWGIAVIADSAQFSAIISEVAEKRYIGTALTLQVALGFLLTAFAIRAIAAIAGHYGWQTALASMAVGPLLGVWAMSRLMQPSIAQ
jgi:MFS family permease